jgi:two-component system, cell cycle response regulator
MMDTSATNRRTFSNRATMPPEHSYTIALCGFNSRDGLLLASASKLSKMRSRRYEMAPAAQVEGKPDLYLVDDSEAGWAEWRRAVEGHKNPSSPILGVAQGEALAHGGGRNVVVFKRPLAANRLLNVLDELISRFFGEAIQISDQVSAGEIKALRDQEGAFDRGRAGRRVLVIDDSESVRKLLEVKLGSLGLQVDFAEDGERGLSLAREGGYDLIFLDVMLPGLDGYDVCRHLKKDYKIATPVVLLTSRTSRLDKLRGTLADADAYLAKPLSGDDLNATLMRFLERTSG